MMSKEAMKLACKALRDCHYYMINAGLPNQSLLNEAFTAYMELEAALAKQPAQQEPDWLDKQQTETDWDHVWLLIKAASYASSRGFISGTSNWGSAVSRYMRNESTQPAQRKPLTHEQRLEVLTRFKKYDTEWHGPAILIDLVEAAHGIKENT
jgi:hypothetical protein